VLLLGRRDARNGVSGVAAADLDTGLSSGAGGISSGGKSRAASCTGDMLTETDEGGVGKDVRVS